MGIQEFQDLVTRMKSGFGISLEEIAKEAKISRQALHKILTGETDPLNLKLGTLVGISRALGLPPYKLLDVLIYDSIPARKSQKPIPYAVNDPDDKSTLIDETIPDNSMVKPGEEFEKIWVIKNVGKRPWLNRQLVRMDDMHEFSLKSEQSYILLPDTKAGQSVTIRMKFKAPLFNCNTISYWKMLNEEGQLCFPGYKGIWCMVSVRSE